MWAQLDGELANLMEVRAALERRGYPLRAARSQEAVVHLYEEYGPACVHLLRGSFALAVYDTRRRRLWLARDALGTRPLYYSIAEGRLFFGSLIVPLLEAPGVSLEPDPAGLSAFLRAGMVPAPRTLFRDVRKLAPGQWLLADESGVRVEQYWAPVLADADRPVSAAVAARECGRMLDEWVAGCLSEGNEGAVLVNGGFGSALIAAAAAKQAGGPVWTLAVAFDDPPKTRDGARARAPGGAPGFEIVEERLSSIEAERVLQEVVGRLAEPPAAESVLLDEWACRSLPASARVLLKADGALELFGGSARLSDPSPGPRSVSGAVRRLRERLGSRAGSLALAGNEPHGLTAARFLAARSVFSQEELGLLAPGLEPRPGEDEVHRAVETLMAGAGNDWTSRNVAAELGLALPETRLTPAACVATGRGVDVRWPFLDRRLVEAVSGLPPRLKALGVGERSLLGRVAGTRLPGWRRQPGRRGGPVLFGPGRVPSLATELLTPEHLRRAGLFRPDAITRMVEEHRRGRPGFGWRLWAVLGVQLWHALFVERSV